MANHYYVTYNKPIYDFAAGYVVYFSCLHIGPSDSTWMIPGTYED